MGVIHHSDRGSQYCAEAYQKLLTSHGFVLSMSGKGNCYGNAMVETVFKTLKSELVWRAIFKTRAQAKIAISQYIDAFYNPKRRHSAPSSSRTHLSGWQHNNLIALHSFRASPLLLDEAAPLDALMARCSEIARDVNAAAK